MKRIFLAILTLCFIFVGVIVSGCGANGIVLSGLPEYEDNIYGNGGLVVRKGDYVYYANGYIEKQEDFGDTISNIQGTVTYGGLYRAKMVEVTTGEGEDAVVTQELQEVQLMVSKVIGFKNGGIFIFKDKIYFTSPSIASDSTGVRYDLLTFFSCNLDGSGLKEFYQTEEYEDTAKYSMTMIDQEVYLLVYTGTKIIKVNEDGIDTELADEVTSAVFPVRENILDNEVNPIENDCFFYYTKDTEPENPESTIDLGNSVYKVGIAAGEETLIYQDYSIQEGYSIDVKLISLTAGKLFYTRNNKYTSAESYYSNTLEGEDFNGSETRHSMSTFTAFMAVGEKDGTNLGVVFINDSKLYLRGISQDISAFTPLSTSTSSSILLSSNGYVYYVGSSDLYRIDVTDTTPNREDISDELTPLTTILDIDGEYCYFLAKANSSDTTYAMYRIALDDLGTNNSTPEKME
ncbi:MAG: hypothetical protein PHS54_04245 [Clostridia bacterium]|nr:hypothetical protein [Clostridia bacterium]